MTSRAMEQRLIWGSTTEGTADNTVEQLGFGPGIDRPAGHFSGVPSAITGNTLRYFTPDPLPDLLRRAASPSWKERHDRDRYAPLLLLRLASGRPAEAGPNLSQARRLISALFEGPRFHSVEALIQLGSSISPKASQIREEIIFVGGPSSSAARHIYAPHGALPELMQSLVEGLTSEEISKCDPLINTSVVAAFCNFMHPFKDGNGRWSRVVAFSAQADPTSRWPAMTVLAFLNACRAELTNEIFPRVAVCGFRSYLERISCFEDALTSELERVGAFEAVTAICKMLHRVAKQPGQWRALATELFVSGQIGTEEIRRNCNVSQRVATGFSDRISKEFPRFAIETKGSLSIAALMQKIDAAIQVAAQQRNY